MMYRVCSNALDTPMQGDVIERRVAVKLNIKPAEPNTRSLLTYIDCLIIEGGDVIKKCDTCPLCLHVNEKGWWKVCAVDDNNYHSLDCEDCGKSFIYAKNTKTRKRE